MSEAYLAPAAREHPLNVETLLGRARARAMLEDFGDPAFRVALDRFVEAINTESLLNADALAQQEADIVSSLMTRLRIRDYFRRHPEIEGEEIRAPVIIVGAQRTGTSKLFRVMASDPQWNVLYTWEALNPVPFSDPPATPDPRIAEAETWAERLRQQGMDQAHAVDAPAPEMEHLLLAKSFTAPSPLLILPEFQAWCEQADYRPTYDFLHDQLKFLQWQKRGGGKRWMLKTPFHLHNLGVLMETFPDATLVMTHRDPRLTIASMVRIAVLMQETNAVSVDREKTVAAWSRIPALGLLRSVAFREAGGEPLFVDGPYRRIVQDSATVVREIYQRAGAPFTAETEASIAGWEDENPQHKGGSYRYSLEEFGLTEAGVSSFLEPYLKRFGQFL